MKLPLFITLLVLPILLLSQDQLQMSEVEERQELSMSEVNGKSTNGIYRYYAINQTEPFTGVLYAKHPNGKTSSWQEYIDGVGQGKWINYYPNGNQKEIGYYEQNKVQGPIKKFHSNGKLQAKGQYKDWRIKINKWTYYDTNGEAIKTIDYGDKGSIEEVQAYYDRGEIPYSWYAQILASNGF